MAADNTITTRVNCGTISYVNVTTYKGDTIQTLTTAVNAGLTKKRLIPAGVWATAHNAPVSEVPYQPVRGARWGRHSACQDF
jgi:hypothetical protein